MARLHRKTIEVSPSTQSQGPKKRVSMDHSSLRQFSQQHYPMPHSQDAYQLPPSNQRMSSQYVPRRSPRHNGYAPNTPRPRVRHHQLAAEMAHSRNIPSTATHNSQTSPPRSRFSPRVRRAARTFRKYAKKYEISRRQNEARLVICLLEDLEEEVRNCILTQLEKNGSCGPGIGLEHGEVSIHEGLTWDLVVQAIKNADWDWLE